MELVCDSVLGGHYVFRSINYEVSYYILNSYRKMDGAADMVFYIEESYGCLDPDVPQC